MIKLITLLCLYLMMSGCINGIPSFEDYYDPVVERGGSIEEYRAAGTPQIEEKTYDLDNGNTVYVFPVGSRCKVHLEANQDNIIVDYRGEGSCW